MNININVKVRVIPISEGKNNNIHYNIKFGSRKNSLITVKFVVFLDNDKAHITKVSISDLGKSLGMTKDTEFLYLGIKEQIEFLDFTLADTLEDFLSKRETRTSDDIINKYKYKF